jgi:hypothetical protein
VKSIALLMLESGGASGAGRTNVSSDSFRVSGPVLEPSQLTTTAARSMIATARALFIGVLIV